MKTTEFYGYVYDFGVDYDAVAVNDILDIHKYLMKKAWYKMMCGFLELIWGKQKVS